MYHTTPAAEAIVARVAHLLAPAEITRVTSSLEIDLDHTTEAAAITRALRMLHRTRMQAENARYDFVEAQLAEIAAVLTNPAPVSANAHVADVNHPAAVLTSWFSTAHVATTPLVFRTRVESPVL